MSASWRGLQVAVKCSKCGGDVTFPSVEGMEAAASALLNTSCGAGMAMAYLWMVSGCIRGLCLLCQPSSISGFVEASKKRAAEGF